MQSSSASLVSVAQACPCARPLENAVGSSVQQWGVSEHQLRIECSGLVESQKQNQTPHCLEDIVQPFPRGGPDASVLGWVVPYLEEA